MTTGPRLLLAAIVTAVAALDVLAHPHGETWWHHLPGFDLIFGLVGCAIIVTVSKALGKAWLQHRERFYEGPGE